MLYTHTHTLHLENKRKNKENGITLIALIITIIVLLILAGISVSMLMGENGILTQANNAKKKSEESKEVESIEVAFLSAQTKNPYEISQEKIEKELNNSNYKVSFDGDYYKVISNDTKNEYIFDQYGNIQEKGKYYYDSENVISDGNIKINVGDSINYRAEEPENNQYISSAEKNGYANQSFTFQNDLQWVVLGVNNKGELLITSKESIETNENERFYLKGETGFKYGIAELDNICKLYGNGIGAKSVRSIRIEDINQITKYDPMSTGNGQKYGKGNLNEYGNEVTFYWNESKFPYYMAVNGVKGNCKIEHNSFYLFDTEKNIFNNRAFKTGKMQYIDKIKTNFYTYYLDTLTDNSSDNESNIKKNFSKAYDLINGAGAYWTASKTMETNEKGVYYGFRIYAGWMKAIAAGGFYSSYGNNNDGQSGDVRPVITIHNNITLTGNSTDGWNIE